MLNFRGKDNVKIVYDTGIDTVHIIAYKDMLIVVDKKEPINTLLDHLRAIFGNKSGSLTDLVNFGVIEQCSVFYRVPFTNRYINCKYNRISLQHPKGGDIPRFMLPIILDLEMINVILEPNIGKDELVSNFIGELTVEQNYLIARHFIHIPLALFIDENKENIKAWYSKIRFVTRDKITHPILIGDDILFASYVNKDNKTIELGISPAYPNIMIKRCSPDDYGPEGKLVLSKYEYLYKYLEFSYSLPPEQCLTGYIGFTGRFTYDSMVHLPVGSYGRNLEGKDVVYMIASAMVGGRTEKNCCFSVDKMDQRLVHWVDSENIYGTDSIIMDYKDEYMSKITRS